MTKMSSIRKIYTKERCSVKWKLKKYIFKNTEESPVKTECKTGRKKLIGKNRLTY